MAMTLQQMKTLYPHDPMRVRLIDKFLDGSESRILPMLHFVDSTDALGYNFQTQDDLGDVGERSLNAEYQTSAPTSSPKRETLSIFGGAIRTDAIFIDAKGDEARLHQIDKRMTAAGKYFDDQFFHGSVQVSAKQFDGLQVRSERRGRILWAGANGGPLTQGLLDEALDAVSGENSQKVVLCSRPVRREISKLGKSRARDVAQANMQAQDYNDAPIRTLSENHKYEPIFRPEIRGTNDATYSLYVVRFGRGVDQQHLQGIRGPTFMKHRQPVNMGEWVKDVIDNVLGIVDFDPHCFMRIGGITLAA